MNELETRFGSGPDKKDKNARDRRDLAGRPRSRAPWLVLAVLLLLEAVLVVLHIRTTWDPTSLSPDVVATRFHLGYETNVPTAFATLQLFLLGGLLVALLFRLPRESSVVRRVTSWSIALGAFFLGLDEWFEIHESVGNGLAMLVESSPPGSFLRGLESFGSYYWLLIYVPLALPVGAMVVYFFYRWLYPRHALAIAGLSIWMLGGFGMDFLEGRYGTPNHTRIPVLFAGRFYRFDAILVEETLEMLGVTLIVFSLLRRLSAGSGGEASRLSR